VKLLRVLQEHTYEAVGDNQARRADARIIAATNRDLRSAVVEGTFREDLYYRLRVFPIVLPPLRARREDIEPIARALLSRVAGESPRGHAHGRLPPSDVALLDARERELQVMGALMGRVLDERAFADAVPDRGFPSGDFVLWEADAF
jgi:transcriptional regulator with GAF, ATPase, and Fis domain